MWAGDLNGELSIKAWPNACNISMQHLATLWSDIWNISLYNCDDHSLSCNIVGYNMLHKFDHPVAICCNMLDDVGTNLKRSNFSRNILVVVWCCTRLATFTQPYWTRACALGSLVECQGPGTHKHPHVELKILRAFGQLVQNMSQHQATML